MELEDFMGKYEKEELIAFLTSYVPIAFSDTNTSIPKIKNKEINELIAKGPENYIAPECIKACENLWSKNIYVLASVNIKGEMYLILDKLSPENMEIFKSKYRKKPENYCTNLGKEKYIAIKTLSSNNKEISEQLEELVSDFRLQDIQRGYFTEKTFLMNVCNCEKVEGLKEYKNENVQIVFDIEKMERSFKEYLKDTGYENYYVPKEHRIYLNDYYYQAHQNYMNNKIENI